MGKAGKGYLILIVVVSTQLKITFLVFQLMPSFRLCPQFQDQNAPMNDNPKIFVQPFRKFPVLLGDRVQVMIGKDKGKQGIVNYIVKERNWVFVEGLHLERMILNRDHVSPGMIMARELPLLYPSQVQLVDPTDKLPTQSIEWRFDEEGNDVRVSVRTERLIPIPEVEAYSTIDYKTPDTYKEQPKDTTKSQVEEVTFKPKLATFEMDLMEQYGIEENRIPYQFFWY